MTPMNRTMAHEAEKHEFALFVESLSSLVRSINPGQQFIITDESLFHRMMTVLRLRVGDTCVVFDSTMHALCAIGGFVGKKHVHMVVQTKNVTTSLRPNITFLLPLLKRDDYENALYALAEVGVNTIQLVSTKKTQGSWSGQRDKDRTMRILVAAAEQSKNYAIPEVKAPVPLDVVLGTMSNKKERKIFFDPAGQAFFTVMSLLAHHKPEHVVLLIGPEGDLTVEEKKMAQQSGFIFCALTPTVIRAAQAAALGAGFVRSLLVEASF